METLHNGFTLELPEGTFPLSTDSMVLSHFVRLPRNARVLDLGSGCGTLGLLLCAKDPNCFVSGVELTESGHRAAVDNIGRNHLESRMESICADLRTVPSRFPQGSFSCVISNPPYFSGGPASDALPIARREDSCNLSQLFAAAGWALKYGGDFFLVHRPERLGQIIAEASALRMEAKRLCLLRHHAGGPVNLILLQFRKGGKPGLLWEEWALFDQNGAPTDIYREIYHI